MDAPEFLGQALADVLGNMCFAFPQSAGCGPVTHSIATQISFHGDINGELRLGVDETLAKRLAADFLGVESDAVTGEQARAFSLELANVVCGNALGAVGKAKLYTMSVPSLVPGNGLNSYPYCFSVVSGNAEIGLDLNMDIAG